MLRRSIVAVLVALPILVAPAVASATDAPERTAIDLVNRTRERHDLRVLRVRARLMRYAERHARAMARKHRLFHSALSLDGYHALGEIVGEGDSVLSVHRAFLRSRTHRKIMLGTWRWIGVGVATRNGTRYVSEVFAR